MLSDPNPTESNNPTQPVEPQAEARQERPKTPLSAFFEHQANAAQEAMQAFDALIPPDFRTHSRAAKREFLAAFKVLLDGALASVEHELNKTRHATSPTDQGSSGDGPSSTGPTKVKVEVT